MQAEANTLKISSEGRRAATIIEAEACRDATIIKAHATAEKYRIEAKGRDDAGKSITDSFTKEFMMKELEVNMLAGLKAQTLTLVTGSGVNSISKLMDGKLVTEVGHIQW